MPPCATMLPDGVALFREHLVRQRAAHGGLRGREAHVRLGGRALAVDFERDVRTEADALVREKARGFGDRLLVHEGAVRAAEVFEQDVVVVDREQRVPAREQRGVGVDVRLGGAPDHVFARRQSHARQLGTGVKDDDFGQRDVHDEPERDKFRSIVEVAGFGPSEPMCRL